MTGLREGIVQIAYISAVIVIISYIFAIIAILLLSKNDPLHFGTIGAAMVSLLRVATLDSWTDLMRVQYLGCDKYSLGKLVSNTSVALQAGQVHCDPTPMPLVAVSFFIGYATISALVMLSMFIGAITISMVSR